jgi:hypothetical protein
LEKWEVWGIGRGKGELVNGGNYTSIGDGPFKIARGLAAYDAGRGATMTSTMTRIRGSALGCGIISARGEKLGNAEIALGRGCQQVILGILRTMHEDEDGMT